MRIFVDANILVSVLNNEQPKFRFTARILSLPDFNSKYKLYTSPICLAIAFYFAKKNVEQYGLFKKLNFFLRN